MVINYSKTVCIEFKNKYRITDNDYSFAFNNHLIKIEKTALFLGITLDSHLDWRRHIETVSAKLNKSFYVINSLKNSLSTHALLNVYYALVFSPIAYNIIVWGQSSDISRIFILQKRILRLLFNLEYNQSCREIFKENKILTVTSIYLMKLLTYIFVNKNKFTHNGDFHNYPTRGRNLICLSKHSHQFYKKSPINFGCRVYNLLPDEIKDCRSLFSFKNRLKKLLINNSFYSLDEFTLFLQNKVS